MIFRLFDFEFYWLLILSPIVLLPHLWSPTHLRLAIMGLLLFWLLRLVLNLGLIWRGKNGTRINADERGWHPSSFTPHPSKNGTRMNTDERGWHPSSFTPHPSKNGTRMNTDERGWHPSSFIPHPLNIAIGTLLCCLPISLWIAIDSTLAWQAAGYLLFGITFAAAVTHHRRFQNEPLWLAYLLILLGCGLAILSLLLYGAKRGIPTTFISGIVPLVHQLDSAINANVLAGALVLIFPVALALAIGPNVGRVFRNRIIGKNSVSRWLTAHFLLMSLAALTLAGGLLLTGSRGGYAAMLVGMMVVCGLRWPRVGRLLLGLSFVLILSVGIGLTYFDLSYLHATNFYVALLDGWLDRQAIWERAWLALQDFPLTGIGLAQFGVVIPEFYPYFHRFNLDIAHAHNLWLQISMDLGLLGLVSYLAIQINFGWMLQKAYRSLEGTERAIVAGLCGSFSALITHGLVDAVSWGTKLSFIAWLVMALGVLLFGKLA